MKWWWLVAGNRYFQCDDARKVDVSDEDGGLSVRGSGGGMYELSQKGVK